MSLLNNAIESIQVGVEDYLNGDKKRYLSAVRNICAGILLLYKEKLYRLSPSHDKEVLIKKDIRPVYDDDTKNITFIGKGKKTVDVYEIKERFKSLDIEVDWKKFEELNKLRNNIEHYYTDKSPEAIREVIVTSFLLIRDFISESLKEEPINVLGKECWQALLDTTNVYQTEEKACRQTFEKCGFDPQVLEQILEKARCPFCHSRLIKAQNKHNTFHSLICCSCNGPLEIENPINVLGKDCWQASLNTPNVYQTEEKTCRQTFEKCGFDPQVLEQILEKMECSFCGSHLIKAEDEYDAFNSLICCSCDKPLEIKDAIEEETLSYDDSETEGSLASCNSCESTDSVVKLDDKWICLSCNTIHDE
ncbi:MAG: Clp protease N-terminal domain-containing protein, partial [Spirulinaceae cyanobacterium]